MRGIIYFEIFHAWTTSERVELLLLVHSLTLKIAHLRHIPLYYLDFIIMYSVRYSTRKCFNRMKN